MNLYELMDTEAGFAASMLIVGILLISLEYIGMVACSIYQWIFGRTDDHDHRD